MSVRREKCGKMSSDFLVNYILMVALLLCLDTQRCLVSCGGAPGDTVVLPGPGVSSSRYHGAGSGSHQHHPHPSQAPHHQQSAVTAPAAVHQGHAIASSGQPPRNSYAMLSAAMSHAVSNEFSSLGSGSADGSCHADDLDCFGGSVQDRLGMEAIKSLHRQLDDDDNGNIDLSESDDFLREELKYDSGYEKRHKAFHYNDDMHISVKELWEAWLRSEVHNWTVEQTTDWLAQSVQLPQYVDLFRLHKVTGAVLPRLAVNNMHYVSNVLGIKDPIHKQKIALKAMDVVLFGPPRETGTRWKDYILVTLLLSAIIGCWYAYQQNKNAKKHLRRMAQDMEGLQKAENALQEMQKELERARMEQENVATEKLDLERRLKEAPSLTSSSSDLELQQLKQEIEMLRSELSRAEVELVDHCWSPPPQLQSWLQYTYELENKNHLKKRVQAEKQLQGAREACEKLKRKRSSLVGAFVSTHGKSIDDVDRSIVEARNALSEVTNELQERLHRWKQIELLLGFSIVNNNGLPYLENVLYSRNGSGKSARGRLTNSTDDLDDDSVQATSSDPKVRTPFQRSSPSMRSLQHISQRRQSSPAPLQAISVASPPPHQSHPDQVSLSSVPAASVERFIKSPLHNQLQASSDHNLQQLPVQSTLQQPMQFHHHFHHPCHQQQTCQRVSLAPQHQHLTPQQQQHLLSRQRLLRRRHTVIPKWKIPILPIPQASTVSSKSDAENFTSPSERSQTKANLHSSHSVGCIEVSKDSNLTLISDSDAELIVYDEAAGDRRHEDGGVQQHPTFLI
ncbi:stromal interaction molecule homolog isoform X2 [Hermetia illucens]|uniref:stromal interaction molecule homolog isoform X2 n=1 Tax=Hermetia illucens TaxID=343691 RepID=UPI0018CC4D09|nr:stromal interaction molecule homolog isoform X2 [Hermetia illucens]